MSDIRKRQNVFNLGEDWAEPVLWYARGVKAMKARKLEESTSWNFYAAIHGISRGLWDFYNFTKASDADPSLADTSIYLNQCQHQSWYFLPWHRGYLLALENVIRHEIKLLNGPHESWALPYWNYFAAGQNKLPPAFSSQGWPDGANDNPLFVEQRWGDLAGGAPYDITQDTNLNSMEERDFFGPGGGVAAGFGGPLTGFNWTSGTNGALEANPHNVIHSLVGGEHPTATFQNGRPLPGLMSTPVCAALDPIFYLHHCNIDRLWESWNNFFPEGKVTLNPTDWKNPTIDLWLDGPSKVGQRSFAMPNPDKSKWTYNPNQMKDISELGYEYDDLSPGALIPFVSVSERMNNLGIIAAGAAPSGATSMASQVKAEMLGASSDGMRVAGSDAMESSVPMDTSVRAKVSETLSGLAISPKAPDRVFLNLENVTGASDAAMFRVYVGLPEGADPNKNPDYLAGTISLFGISQASGPQGQHAGNGITYTLEITKIVDKLHLEGNFDVDELPVKIIPRKNISEMSKIYVGRISIYRQYE